MDPSGSAESLSTLYPACTACRKRVDALLASFEAPLAGAAAGASPASVAAQQQLMALTQQLAREVARLESVFERERATLPSQQAALWRRRIAVLREDTHAVQNAVDVHLGSVHRRQVEERRQREALFDARRFRGAEETRAAELSFAREREKLEESRSALDAILAQGRGVLDKMVHQNSVLKSAKRKILDMTTSAGLSASVLGAVSRREATDRRLVWGGMLFTLLFFFLLYRYVHGNGSDAAETAWESAAAPDA
ncbi:unnamed protein product [Neospora caninum Liverpool]|uniref:Golgi SNARE protein, putative n=1 Tax=Neospora caninum (strain Liverpool) TaxID=572307 RepID=F0VK55_NEOCL|nr:uncharacterized protein NCLIV_048850 [Neospora caninum Liverpool]CBZ54456.1 unnamed protein product [Neospora caninum Liverpool]CEL69168.1 TPA: golgi SNARE protein, putative [Neospora caninum Liverpool]|eukprot:XP_003884486.1 uncharacterized protein NCLIV_048850 [Neospora caninum Liverpool]